MTQRSFRLLVFGTLLASTFLSACTPLFVDGDQPTQLPDHALVLEPGRTLGQTFVAQHGGLNGIEVWLQPSPDANGMLVLRLREDFDLTEDLARAALPVGPGMSAGFYRFGWATEVHSHGAYRYAQFEFTGHGQVSFGAANGESYLNGAAYVDGKPRDDRQLAFRLTYDWWGILTDLARRLVWYIQLLGVTIAIFVAPGVLVLKLLGVLQDAPFPAQIGLAAGISVALHPLVLLWAYAMGIPFGAVYAWLPIVLGLAGAVFWFVRRRTVMSLHHAVQRFLRSDAVLPDLAFLVVTSLAFGVRMLVVSSLPAPLWGDSYHHSMVTQLIIDHSGLFDSWMPYAPLATFTYHFGFHTSAALLHWTTGVEAHMATLWAGQIINALAVVALYPLAWQLTQSRWAGVVTVLIAGLILPMPMYYVNWGRYTQLTGQVILPAAAVLLLRLFTNGHRSQLPGRTLLVAALTFSGLLLTHYRVSMILACLLPVTIVYQISLKTLGAKLRVAVLLAGMSILLTLPWWIKVAGGLWPSWLYRYISTLPQQRSEFWIGHNANVGALDFYMPYAFWLGWLCAVGVALWSRNRTAAILSAWVVVVLLVVNPDWIGLPGAGAITNFTLAIGSYVIAAPFLSYLVVRSTELIARSKLPTVIRWAVTVLTAAGCVFGGVIGLTRFARIITPSRVLVTVPDQKAMNWIKANTPENAVFLIDTFVGYGGEAVVGADAGWWTPLLARRANTVPPLTYLGESSFETDFQARVNTFAMSWINGSKPIALAMREAGIEYLYLGQTHQPQRNLVRRLNEQLPSELELVYKRDRVAVYKLKSAEANKQPLTQPGLDG